MPARRAHAPAVSAWRLRIQEVCPAARLCGVAADDDDGPVMFGKSQAVTRGVVLQAEGRQLGGNLGLERGT